MHDLRKRSKHSRDCLPIGTIVLRRRKVGAARRGRRKARYIKVRNSGPKGRRWILYARWWWLQNKGPIPPGKRVIHLDGDSLNDHPDNLALGDPADVAFIWHDQHPEASEANYRACRAQTGEFNRLMASVRRRTTWLATRWYLVDFARKRVLNRPMRQINQLWGATGANGGGGAPRALGWPGHPLIDALVLTALADAGQIRGLAAIAEHCRRLRQHWAGHLARKPIVRQSIASAVCRLRSYDLVLTIADGGREKVYCLTAVALAERGPVSPWVPRRGADVERECVGFAKVDDGSVSP